MQIDQTAIDKIADSILKVIEKKLSDNNAKVVSNAIKNHKVDGDHIVRESIGNVHIKDAAIDTAKIKNLTAEIARIAVAEIGTAVIGVAQIESLSATVANIVQATIQSADIEWADIANLTATIAAIAVANIETARIDFAQIDGLTAGVALIQEAVGGKVQIADLSVSDANIVTLNANKITAGTLSVERLVIVGSTQSIVYAINEANGTAQLSQTTIDGGSITEKTITADQIIAHGITADCLNVAEIFANEALIGAITTSNIAAGTITAASAIIADGAITTAKIGDAQITSAKIADANITTAKIGDAQITGAKIADATITGAKIANATITDANIAEATITSANIGNGQITTAKIGDAQITNAKINDLNATKINAGTLSADRIASGSITTDKLAASAVTADKIDTGSLVADNAVIQSIKSNSITRVASLPLSPVVGETVVYIGTTPAEPLQWTGRGSNPTQRTYPVTKSGVAVEIPDLSNYRTLDVTVKTVATQAGSGTPSPSNVRPISGMGQVYVQRRGKNLMDPEISGQTKNGVTLTYYPALQEIALNGTCTTDNTTFEFANYPTQTRASHIFSVEYVSGSRTISGLGIAQIGTEDWSQARAADLPASGRSASSVGVGWVEYRKASIRVDAGSSFSNYRFRVQLEFGETASAWEPYSGKTFTLTPSTQMLGLASAPDTIGSNGSVQHQTDAIVLDGSGDWWFNPGWTGNAYRLAGAIPQAQSISGYGTVADLMCSHFPAATPAAIADGALGIGIGNGTEIYVGFPDESVVPRQDIAALKAWLAAHPVVLVYRLATPSTETITPVEITGVDGVNTVTSDGTVVEVEYTGSGWERVANSIMGSSVQITDEFIRVQSDKFSVGNDSDPTNDALVIEDGAVSAPMIESPSVMPAYTGPATIVIKADATDAEMEAGTAFKTLAQAIAGLNRKWLPYRVTIYVSTGYDGYGDISINHISGDMLTIGGSGSYAAPSDSMPRHTGFLYLYNNTAPITIQQLRIRFATTASTTMVALARICRYVYFSRCVIEDTGIGGAIVRADQGSAAFVQECAMVNAAGATNAAMLVARYGSTINSQNLIGELSSATVLFDVLLGTIYHDGTAPVCSNATIANNTTRGVAAHSISSRVAFRGSQGGQQPTPTSLDIPMSSGASYWDNGGWNSAMYQGYTNGKGRCTTCLWFDVSALAGKTILSATLKLHRYSGVGKSAGVYVRPCPVNNAGASGSLSRGSRIATIGSIASGATSELDLPNQVVQDLVAGTYKAIGLYPGDSSLMDGKVYSTNYARWYKDAVLSVVYQ